MGMIGTAICCASGKSYNSFLAGRLVQAFGTTAFESLSLAAVGDLYMHLPTRILEGRIYY